MIITTVKKTIKAVIILVLLLPFYVIPSQQSIKKNIQKVGVGQEFAQKFPKLCFTLASSDMQVEPIFISRESMRVFPCFQQQEQNNFILPNATPQNLLDFHKYLVLFCQQKNKDAKQGGFHHMDPIANLSKYMQGKPSQELLTITQYALLVFPAEEPFGLTDLCAKAIHTDLCAKAIQEEPYSADDITELLNKVKISESDSKKIFESVSKISEAAVASSKNILPKKVAPKEVCWVPKDSNLRVINRKEPPEIILQEMDTAIQSPEPRDDVALKLENEKTPIISNSIKENEIINGFFVPRKWFALDPIKLMIQIGRIGLLPLAFCVCKYIYLHH